MATDTSFGFCSVSTMCLMLSKCSFARLRSPSSALHTQISTDVWYRSYFNRLHPVKLIWRNVTIKTSKQWHAPCADSDCCLRNGHADLSRAWDCGLGHLYSISAVSIHSASVNHYTIKRSSLLQRETGQQQKISKYCRFISMEPAGWQCHVCVFPWLGCRKAADLIWHFMLPYVWSKHGLWPLLWVTSSGTGTYREKF